MRVHFTGACGRAIGSLALELKRKGWEVTASDATQYAPMDRVLREGGLEIRTGFSGRHVPAGTDVLVRGTAIANENLELKAARRRGIPILNMAQFLEQHLLKRSRRFVIAGTNGKTSTTAMLAWILEFAGQRPDYLMGGICPHFESLVRFRSSRWTVLEGDEYPSGENDPQPKFLHYRPHVLLLTNI